MTKRLLGFMRVGVRIPSFAGGLAALPGPFFLQDGVGGDVVERAVLAEVFAEDAFAGHAQFLHHAAGGGVVGEMGGRHAVQVQFGKGKVQARCGRLRWRIRGFQ